MADDDPIRALLAAQANKGLRPPGLGPGMIHVYRDHVLSAGGDSEQVDRWVREHGEIFEHEDQFSTGPEAHHTYGDIRPGRICYVVPADALGL
jgi:hypothetical protein